MKIDKSLLPPVLRTEKGRIFFLGIGGSGMYGVACLCHALGFSVCGTDQKESKNTSRLRALGIPLCREEEALPSDIGVLVYSFAIADAHPLLREAKARELPCFDRATFFGMLMRVFPVRAAVAGSHGKSSTTAMCAQILEEAGRSPTVISGADLGENEGSFRLGTGDCLLFEACEYKDAFLSFCPTYALALGASWEHTDYFPSEAAVIRSFSSFLTGESVYRSVAPRGFLTADMTYGEGGDVFAREIETLPDGSRFLLLTRDKGALGRVTLAVMGDFQVQNALAAATLCFAMGVPAQAVLTGLNRYRGIPRRMEKKGMLRGVPLYLDFAHHPKELFCVLRTLVRLGRPTAVVFEPHTYSRTKSFFGEYVRALKLPHMVGVLPIYAARETDTGGISSQILAKTAGVAYLPDYAHAARFLVRAAGKGCSLLLVGAGGVEGVLPYLFPYISP